jgi:2-polyprenyl-3-methyl-5-hydroxy-6-metoxy-1,4-benzoquinol methylase
LDAPPDRRVDQKFIELSADYIIPRLRGERILELGAGDRIWTRKLVERFEHVTTVDAAGEILRAMRERLAGHSNWTGVVSYFEDYYQPQERFDTVVATGVLEHVDDPLVVLQRARTHWLRRGGQIAITVPHALSLHRRLAVVMGLSTHPGQLGEADRRLGHQRCLTCFEMDRIILEAGLKIVERKGLVTKLLPNALMTQCSGEQLKGMFDLGLELPIEYAASLYYLAEPCRE